MSLISLVANFTRDRKNSRLFSTSIVLQLLILSFHFVFNYLILSFTTCPFCLALFRRTTLVIPPAKVLIGIATFGDLSVHHHHHHRGWISLVYATHSVSWLFWSRRKIE